MEEIFNGLADSDFIAEFDPSYQNLIHQLIEQGASYEQIGIEMSAMPSLGMTTKGSGTWDKDIFKKILAEVAVIICGDGNDPLSQKLKSETNITSTVITTITSGYVGSTLGFAAALCTPFVLLAFAVILKAGKNVFCQSFNN